MQERFFFLYHLKCSPSETDRIEIYERKWTIERFFEQKSKENEAIQNARNKAKSK